MRSARLALCAAVVVSMVCSILAALMPSPGKEDQEEPMVALDLVSEKEFGETVMDFSLGISAAGESFPRVVVVSDKVLIFDDQTRKVTEITRHDEGHDFFALSESGNNIIQSWQYAPEGAKELEECRIYVYDLSGRLLWTGGNIAPARFPLVAANGHYFVAASYSRLLWVSRDGSSSLINPFAFVEEEHQLGRVFLSISSDSKHWAVSCGEGTVVVGVYDSSASGLWSELLERGGAAIAGPMAVSRGSEYIGAIYPEGGGAFVPLYFHLFHKSQKLLWKKEIYYKGDYLVLFAPTNEYVFLVSNKDLARCLTV